MSKNHAWVEIIDSEKVIKFDKILAVRYTVGGRTTLRGLLLIGVILMAYVEQFSIDSLGNYVDTLDKIHERQAHEGKAPFLWYRGHGDKSWELVPKVQRGFSGEDEALFRRERGYTNDFQSRAKLFYHAAPPLDDFSSWLTLMQHYGLPTRLLDWSRSPLIALFFALSDPDTKDKDACIWILNPGRLNASQEIEHDSQVGGKKYKNEFIYNTTHKVIQTMIYTAFRRWAVSNEPDEVTPDDKKFDYHYQSLLGKIAACYPTEADARVYNQQAAFTVHNSSKKLTDICDELTLQRVIIPNESKPRLHWELELCGITESYIFPDLEHLAAELTRIFPL